MNTGQFVSNIKKKSDFIYQKIINIQSFWRRDQI